MKENSPEINPQLYDFQMIFKRMPTLCSEEKIVFSTNGAREMYIHMEKNEDGPLLDVTDKN